MNREDKILLVTNGAFCVGSLLLLLYLPKNSLFYLSNTVHSLLYIPPFVCFLMFLKKRSSFRAALILTWVSCAVLVCCAALFGIANMYSLGVVMVN